MGIATTLRGHDSWSLPLPDDKMAKRLAKLSKDLEVAKGLAIDDLNKDIAKLAALRREVEAARDKRHRKASTAKWPSWRLQHLDHAVKSRGLRLSNYYPWPTVANARRSRS